MSNTSKPTHEGLRDAGVQIPFLDQSQNATDGIASKPQSFSCRPLILRSEFDKKYQTFQAMHMRGFIPGCQNSLFQADDVKSLFESLNERDKESWCIENEANNALAEKEKNGDEKAEVLPQDFLDVNNREHRGYCSFLVQHSKGIMKDLFTNRLPLADLPVAEEKDDIGDNADKEACGKECSSCSSKACTKTSRTMKVHYGPCLWLFFGKNKIASNTDLSDSKKTLQGRPEHTDSVTHDGTWHYQLSGTKVWRLRPTTELLDEIKEQTYRNNDETGEHASKKRKFDVNEGKPSNDYHGNNKYESNIYIEVECRQGDILVLNTRLWWHSTLIPPQDVPCISYARDIYFPTSDAGIKFCGVYDPDTSNNEDENESNQKGSGQEQSSSMTNVDGTYAAEDIEASTILFTEHTMPDCELHRSKENPNCQVVELKDEETGESYMAVVSMRDIKAGEFFCILESDEEDGDEEEEDEGSWDAEEQDED